MRKVHLLPAVWVVAGIGVLALVRPSVAGWVAGVLYLLASMTLLIIGLRRRGDDRLGPANAVTATRSMLVGVVLALTVTSYLESVATPLMIGLIVPALALDAVDGWTARRTGSATPLGARFDMEVDAFFLLVLGVYVAPLLGAWVLAIGLMRYAYVAAGWVLPWLRGTVPPRYWRKVVAAICGIALALGASQLVPAQVAAVAIGGALVLLIESFGRDVVWLYRNRTTAARPPRPRRAERSRSG